MEIGEEQKKTFAAAMSRCELTVGLTVRFTEEAIAASRMLAI